MDLSTVAANKEMHVFDDLRKHRPVHWNARSQRGPGFWALARHADAKQAAPDVESLSCADGTQILDRKVEGALASVHNKNGPERAKLRRIAAPHLRAVMAKQWQEVISSSVRHLLNEAERHGDFDMVDVLSARLPMPVPTQVLGVPSADPPRMVDRTNPLHAEALPTPAVEETLRYVSLVARMRRGATRRVVIGDKAIAPGDKVVRWFAAANRDPEVFVKPQEFRIDRAPNRHLAFGWGIHFCLGAHLARAEVREFYRHTGARGLRFEVVGPPERVRLNIFRGRNRPPVQVVSARREGR
jgi:cytochrome P450